MTTNTRVLSSAEKLEWRLRALHRYADRLVRESEAHYQAWVAAGRPGTVGLTASSADDDDEHDYHDPDGYCDNPGRGY